VRYEIHVAERLDLSWSASFSGMHLEPSPGGTVIAGPVVDQAALHGLLERARDLGLTLVRVTRIETTEDTHDQPDQH
jgi:hypothetical protein